ncbi:MAG: hypothetical protein A2096_00695 [Spirochaetes bacterium GWF1_41_5]|nr:MAG: hypothetical protein A2096_00695 [Spirochaetes bacterium GWF1_41_5]HBE03525.1 cell division protein [Spirochaetia bacterium]
MAKEEAQVIKIDKSQITTILASDLKIKGSLKFKTSLEIEGEFEGDIHSEGVLVIGENARVKAAIITKSLISHGTIEGNITAVENVLFSKTARHTGDVNTPNIIIESGAQINGAISMRKETQDKASTTVTSKTAPKN